MRQQPIKTLMALFAAIYIFSTGSLAWGRDANWRLGGYLAVEGRFFTESPNFEGQEEGPQGSLVAEPELSFSSANRRHQFKLQPFGRLDSMDEERSHADLREAYWRYQNNGWELLLGTNIVFWGVTESQHLVDIINQTDMLEDVDGEDKLGQPMLMLGRQSDWGDVQLYLMPWFRERDYPGIDGRLRSALSVDDDGRFESSHEEHHPDLALRYSHFLGDWDMGAYYFSGTSRQPRLQPAADGNRLIAHYDQIQQVGIDLQYTRDAWLWKLETIGRQGHGDPFGALVGGFEYTWYQLAGTSADLGWLVEYNWDGRDEVDAPPTFFDNDLFLGSRLTLNDAQDSSLLAGVIVDTKNGSRLISVEAERRLGSAFTIEAQARFFSNIDSQDPIHALAADDFITISLQYHF